MRALLRLLHQVSGQAGRQFAASFAVASILAGLALVTLVLKFIVERRVKQEMSQVNEVAVPA